MALCLAGGSITSGSKVIMAPAPAVSALAVASLGVSKGGGANQTEGRHGGVALTNQLGMQKFILQFIEHIN